jgi:hypothetical protein
LLNEAPNCFRARRAVVLIGNPCVERLHLIRLYADSDQFAFPCRRGAGFFPGYPCYHRLTFHRNCVIINKSESKAHRKRYLPFAHRNVGMNALVPMPSGSSLPVELAPDLTRAAEWAREEKAAATRRAYRSDFRIFEAWCRGRGVSALPASPEAVAAFLAHDVETGSRPSTLGRRVAAIRYAHKLAGHPVPTDDERVKATMRGIRRSLGTAPQKKAPATAERIIAMALATGEDLKGLRDRALLLIGFAGAFRRSELVALDLEDLEETARWPDACPPSLSPIL